jgi:hypothetical protein
LIILNSLMFLYELSLGPGIEAFVYQYGVVPSNLVEWPGSGQAALAVALPYLTSMFLHGDGCTWSETFGATRFLLPRPRRGGSAT